MIVVSVYRPPSTPIDVLMNHMLRDHCSISACTNMYCRRLQWRCINYIKYPLLCNFRLQAFKQMVCKLTHDSGTIIDHVYVSQTVNTVQTDVTDCYYSDHDFILCAITVSLIYVVFLWNNSIHVIHTTLCILTIVKYFVKWRSTQTFNWNVTLTPYQTLSGVHLTEMSVECVVRYGGFIFHTIWLHSQSIPNIPTQKYVKKDQYEQRYRPL